MGIGASTNVKEIRIDQKDAKWESYPSSAGSQRGSRSRGLSLGRRWINSAETSANNRRLQQLNAALEAAEKRAQDAEQRVRQLERELATLELRNMELADEATWLRKQLSDRPEVPLLEKPATGNTKGAPSGAAAGSSSNNPTEAYRTRQAQYLAKLESQIKLYEEDILKLKTKMNKETQRLQAELEDQKHRSDKEVRSLDNRLIEAHKLNQKYEEVISSKISSETVSQLRNEVVADSSLGISASTVRAAASASASGGASAGGDPLSQSKSRAQLILELTEQISTQQDKIRHLEDEIVQRDIDLAHMKDIVQKSEEVAALSASMRKPSHSSNDGGNRVAKTADTVRTTSTSSSRRPAHSEQVVATPSVTPAPSVVANEDEIEALLNNPAMMYGQDDSEEESERQKNVTGNKEEKEPAQTNLSVSQDLQHQMMSASFSVPTSWRKEPSALPPPSAARGSSALPPSGANPKRIISVVNTIDGNNLGGKIGPSVPSRPKTMAAGRPRASPSPKRQQTMDETVDRDESAARPIRQASADNVSSPTMTGTRTHSAPMFSFKPRPSSKQSSKRTALSLAASITGSAVPPPIDLEEEVVEHRQEQSGQKKAASVPATREGKKQLPPRGQSTNSGRRNSDAIEILSLHDQDTNYGSMPTGASDSAAGGYDSSNAAYDDEGDIEDGDDDDDDNSDQEIRRRFEERWKKSTHDPAEDPEHQQTRPKIPRPPAGGGVGQDFARAPSSISGPVTVTGAERPTDQKQRVSTSAKSQDSGFLGDSCASTNSLSLWKGRNKRQISSRQGYDPLDVDKLLEM